MKKLHNGVSRILSVPLSLSLAMVTWSRPLTAAALIPAEHPHSIKRCVCVCVCVFEWKSESVNESERVRMCVFVCAFTVCVRSTYEYHRHVHIFYLYMTATAQASCRPSVSYSKAATCTEAEQNGSLWKSTCWSRAMWRYIHSVDALFSRVRLTNVRLKHNSGYFLPLLNAYGKHRFTNCGLEKMSCTRVYVLCMK